MNETFWGLYETQISALRNSTSSEDANMIMLETAKFLVENIDLSENTLNVYDKFGIRKLFAGYNALGGAVNEFYDTQREYLDPAARNGAIGQKLTATSEQICNTALELKLLQEKESELLKKEEELTKLEKELTVWSEKVIHLRNVEQNAAKEVECYEEAYKKLEKAIKEYDDEVSFWEAHLGENSRITNKMKAYGVPSIGNLLDSIEKIKENIQFDLKALDTLIKKIMEDERQIREEVLKKQNKIV